MKTSRRSFIKTSTVTLAGLSLSSNKLFASGKASDHVLGIQLYTVRDDMQRDPVNTLKQLSSMGYRHVEHAGYENRKFYGFSPGDFKKLLSDLNLDMLSGHSSLDAGKWNKGTNDFTDEWKQTVEDAAAVGMKYLISPGVDESLCKNEDDFKWYMQLFNKTGKLCKQSGIDFAYHNESYEFDHYFGNVRLYDILLNSTDKDLVAQQIDIGNMYGPGGRPMDYLKQYPGRFISMHVKDEIKSAGHEGGYESAILGTGIVHVKEVVDFARKSGTKHFIIEQESYQDKTPLVCAEKDLQVMKSWNY